MKKTKQWMEIGSILVAGENPCGVTQEVLFAYFRVVCVTIKIF